MTYTRGDVVWGSSPFGRSQSRPWLLASNDTHPFDEEEVVCLMLTTTPREIALEIPESAIVDGGFPKQSYVNPWVTTTLKRVTLGERQAELTQSFVDEAVEALRTYLMSR